VRRIALAAAQTTPVRGDVAANVEQHLLLAERAAAAGAGLVLFPELSLTGYELDLAEELAFDERDPRLAPLVGAARRLGATLVVGAPIRLGDRVHLAAFVLEPDGSIGIYTKRRLGAFGPEANPGGSVPPAEATVFAPGDRDPLVRIGDATAAIAICADVGDPAHAATAAARGASVYLASMFMIPQDSEAETRRLGGYANRHGMSVVLANHGGPTGGLPSAGGTAIWSDRGELLGQLDPSGAGWLAAIDTPSGRGIRVGSL
jgi:predicted amidohydrolase